ncbi:hypothetical protein [Spiroplasma endosymbiont of Nephrotoma flavescens]|uniref:hypothetical protein n=1 Tax=Spiroplasma endosymbiont of Nephrotoma flavescens TaxID=3066302 RepID=UPI00313D36ED
MITITICSTISYFVASTSKFIIRHFSNTTKNAVHKFILSLNQRPRKILNYLSPIEYLVRKII